MPVPKIPPNAADEVRHGEGVAGPRYLLREIEDLKAIARRAALESSPISLSVPR
jgi:hypothetical protein